MVARYRLGRNSIVDHAWEGWLWPAPQSGTELKTLGVGIGVGIGIAIAIGSLVILVLSFTDAA